MRHTPKRSLVSASPSTLDALAEAREDARAAGELGFFARLLVMATLPHTDPKTPVFARSNGALHLSMAGNAVLGLPFGSIPRLVLCWVTTEAVRTRSRTLVLGPSLSSFLRQLDMDRGGGPRGNSTRVRNQLLRLFAASVSCVWIDERSAREQGFRIADGTDLWWDPKAPEAEALWASTVQLSERFYQTAVERPVPVDVRALRALRRSPLAIDVYCWLTHRYSYLQRPTTVPWGLLRLQFGASYTREAAFRFNFRRALRDVLVEYPEAKLEDAAGGLRLLPSPTHVGRRLPA
jgi:hypothetical protein